MISVRRAALAAASSLVRARTRSSSSSRALCSAAAWRLSASRLVKSSTKTATFDWRISGVNGLKM